MGSRARVSWLLFAWLLSTGSQWDLLQTVAWTRMFFTYAQSMSVVDATRMTFSGEMCGLCEVVDQAKNQTDGEVPPPGRGEGKVLLFCEREASLVLPPADSRFWVRTQLPPAARDRAAPPSPPPRLVVA